MTEYKVALEVYNGPLDLLLFLIRREEIDIHDIPIARITQQYLQYVELLKQIDPEIVSEFLVLAATLMEIKSRTLLPTPPPEEADEEMVDPRLELVRQLLEYKTYKDVARTLEEAADDRARKHARQPVMPERAEDEVELEALQIWDLFDAFNRLLEQIGKTGALHEVGVDDTPVTLHADDILDSIQRAGGSQPFEDVFAGRTRAEMIGLFLALLELIRRFRIRAIQERPFGPIEIHLLDPTPLTTVEMEDNLFPDGADQPGAGQSPDGEEAAPDENSREPQVPRSSRRPEANVQSLVNPASPDCLPDTVHERGVGDGATQDVATPTGNDQTIEPEQDDDPQ